MAAWLSSSGMKNSTASTDRYRCWAARKTPSSRLIGVWNAHERIMISKVTQSE